MSNREWTPEQKQAASDRMKERHALQKSSEVKTSMRIPMGSRRNLTTVNDTPDGYVDRWVNDVTGRISRIKQAGYEHVQDASVGDSNVDGTHSQDGVVSRDMGQGTTAYLMRQKREDFEEDQTAKQVVVDESEDSIRRGPNDNKNDGYYGSVSIGRPNSKS